MQQSLEGKREHLISSQLRNSGGHELDNRERKYMLIWRKHLDISLVASGKALALENFFSPHSHETVG